MTFLSLPEKNPTRCSLCGGPLDGKGLRFIESELAICEDCAKEAEDAEAD